MENTRTVRETGKIVDKGKVVYREFENGTWYRYGYDDYGNWNYFEGSDGYVVKRVFDEKGNMIRYENNYGLVK